MKNMTKVVLIHDLSTTSFYDVENDLPANNISIQFVIDVDEYFGDLVDFIRSNLGKPIELTFNADYEVNNE